MDQASQVKKAESQFLLVIGTIVVLVGVPTVLSVFRAPDFAPMVSAQKLDSRSPASEQNANESNGTKIGADSLVREISSTALIQLDCENQQGSTEVSGNYIRMTGSPCEDFEDVEITNKSNGFSAAVIFTKGHQFTTDFIDLKDGENNLEIIATRADGSKTSNFFKVIRRAPASLDK